MTTRDSRPLHEPRRGERRSALPLWLLLLSGCTAGGTRTLVDGQFEPRHFRFITVVPKRGKGPGGWRAACVGLSLKRDPGVDSFLCRFGVEMPLETAANGPISTPLAQRISADCASQTAFTVFSSATPETPLGLACENFKTTYGVVLGSAIKESRVMKTCHEKTTPVDINP